jgi:hypothetical protein
MSLKARFLLVNYSLRTVNTERVTLSGITCFFIARLSVEMYWPDGLRHTNNLKKLF